MKKQEYRDRLIELVESAPTDDRRSAVVQKLRSEIDSEEQLEVKEALEQRVALAEERNLTRRWDEFEKVNLMLSDEQGAEIVQEHADKSGLSFFDAYKDLLSKVDRPREPRPVTYTDSVVPESEG